MKNTYRVVLLVILSIVIGGCAQVSFYGQSVLGHSKLMSKRQSVDKVLSESQDEVLKKQIELSQRILEFAHQELALPKTKSYRTYVELPHDFPVWNVVAAKEFSLEPEQWCYLVIGCASYRGYFKMADAQRYAAKLQDKGLETYVGGAIAYSTLGWFKDPLLSSMFRYGDLYLAETLIHELAHQRLYLNNWTTLNESFATIVAEEGMRRWLDKISPSQWSEFVKGKIADDDFADLIDGFKDVLRKVYASNDADADKRRAKQLATDAFVMDYERLKIQKWGGRGWYDNWMSKPINNARIAAYSSYQDYIPELRELLEVCDKNLELFYQTIANLSKISIENQSLESIPKKCHTAENIK